MIHQTAIVSPEAVIGQEVEIGPYAIVESDVRIGDNSVIAAHAVLKSGTRLGEGVSIGSFCVIGGLPQDLRFDAKTETYVEIGYGTTIRENSTVNRATKSGEATIVGANCYLMAVTHLGHDCRLESGVVVGNNSLLGGFVTVGKDSFLGGNSGVHQFCRIGEGVMFGGSSVTTVDVPPYTLFAERNNLYGLNLIGLKRRGHSRNAIRSLKECYNEIFRVEDLMLNGGSLLRERAAKLLISDLGSVAECRSFIEFFGGGERGFARPRSKRAV